MAKNIIPSRKQIKSILRATRKSCDLCQNKVEDISWKKIDLLEEYLTPTGKIISSKQTGICRKHQKQLSDAIKNARIMALIR